MVDQYFLYCIFCIPTDQAYIGITKNVEVRFREHKNDSSNKYLNAAIKQYGLSNFSFEVFEEGTTDAISEKEKEYISICREYGWDLFNIANGGLIGNGAPGEEHWNHELSEDTVVHLRELYATKTYTQRSLASMFNIGYRHVNAILNGKRWANAGGPLADGTTLEVSKVANRRKLTDEQVVELRVLAEHNFILYGKTKTMELTEKYGIAKGSVRLILEGTSYPKLGGPIKGVDYGG